MNHTNIEYTSLLFMMFVMMLLESLSMKLIPTDLEKNKMLELKTKINSK